MTDASEPRLKYFPISFFAIVMGFMGLALALHTASHFYNVAEPAAHAVMWTGIVLAALIAVAYIAKMLRYPGAVVGEWRNPVMLAFFPAATISLLLIASALAPQFGTVARWLWVLGTGGQGILTLAVINNWIGHRSFEVGHLTPAWFIPAVGNVIVPVTGAGFGYIETSWAFFAVGMMFWGILLTLVMNRLIFHDPIPGALFPTMVILIAPPSVAFVAYLKMNGGVVDGFARALIYAGYFFAALVLVEVPKLTRLPFSLSWWALSFPLAALALASFLFARIEETTFHQVVGLVALVALVGVVLALFWRTGVAMSRGMICRPPQPPQQPK